MTSELLPRCSTTLRRLNAYIRSCVPPWSLHAFFQFFLGASVRNLDSFVVKRGFNARLLLSVLRRYRITPSASSGQAVLSVELLCIRTTVVNGGAPLLASFDQLVFSRGSSEAGARLPMAVQNLSSQTSIALARWNFQVRMCQGRLCHPAWFVDSDAVQDARCCAAPRPNHMQLEKEVVGAEAASGRYLLIFPSDG